MSDVDMITAILMKNQISVWDTWSISKSEPPQDIDLDGTDDITIISSVPDSTKGFTVVFSRPLNTGDEYDKVLTAGMTLEICWGTYNKEAYKEHNEYGDGNMTFGLTASDSELTTSSSGGDYEVHGNAMTIVWGILAPLAVIFARYFRHTIWWYWVHIILGLIPIGITVFSVMSVYGDNKGIYSTFDDDQTVHSRLGLIILVLVIILGLLGAISAYEMWRKRSIYKMSVLRKAHAILGRSMVIAGYYNCFIGWDINGSSSGEAFIITVTVILCALFLIFELRLQIASYFPFSKFNLNCRCRKLKEMSHAEVLHATFNHKKKYAFYDEFVIDLFGFQALHPGGSFLIKDAYGEDMGKYLVGCSSYGGNYFPYAHSLRAHDMARKLAIGKLPFPKTMMKVSDDSYAKYINLDWKLVGKTQISKDTYLFKFTNDHQELIRDGFPIDMIGKHFRIDAKIRLELVSRYYSIMFVDLDAWRQLVTSKHPKIAFDSPKEVSAELEPIRGNTMDMIIKIYPNGKVTQYLNGLVIGQSISMKGPFGPGLALTPDFSGACAAFGAGTGVIPFLDLAYRIWEWNSGIKDPGQNISLFLYVSFRSSKDAFAIDILKACAQTSSNFTLHLNIDDDPESKGVMKKEKLSEISISSMQRIWVCGPSGFNRWICNMILDENVPREKILLL
jgi:NAD(P)H-flavin reductase